MIAFRHADPRFPFLREDAEQSSGRWNDAGDLTHYFCDTPEGAWAEFLRHEEIDDPEDVFTIRRALWAVEIGHPPAQRPGLPQDVLTGGPESWQVCQERTRTQRKNVNGIAAPSAALRSGGAHGWRVDGGVQRSGARDGVVFVPFGPRPDLVGWAATVEGRPSERLLENVGHFRASDRSG